MNAGTGDLEDSIEAQTMESIQDVLTNHKVQLSRFDSGSETPRQRLRASLQQHHFHDLIPFVDFLKMLREATKLHDDMTVARRVRYWSGPKTTVDGHTTSDTIQRAFQHLLMKYNHIGEGLQQKMRTFPEEIAQGFAECNPTRAETLHSNALTQQAKLKQLLAMVSWTFSCLSPCPRPRPCSLAGLLAR